MLETIRKRWWLIPLGLGLLAVLAVWLMRLFAPEEILAYQARKEDVLVTLTITGEVQADYAVSVSAPFQARIVQVAVDKGDILTQGQLLVQLEADESQAQLSQAMAQARQARAALAFLEQGTREEELARLEARAFEAQQQVNEAQARHQAAQADYEQAQRYVERLEPLAKQGAISANEFDEARSRRNAAREQTESQRAAIAVARARLTQAAEELRRGRSGPTSPELAEARAAYNAALAQADQIRARIKDRFIESPLNGVVLNRLLEPGDIAAPGSPILRIADRNTLEVVGFIEESDLSRVAVGNTAYVVLDAHPDTALPGIIRRIGNEVNPENGTVEAEVDLKPEDLAAQGITLLPGMTADINIITGELKDAMVLPSTAITKRNNRFWAYVISGGRVHEKPVNARRVSLEYYQILDGLEPGQWVARTADPELLGTLRAKPVPVPSDEPDNTAPPPPGPS